MNSGIIFDHRKRHKELYDALFKLILDWLDSTNISLTKSKVIDLFTWSYKQTLSLIPEKLMREENDRIIRVHRENHKKLHAELTELIMDWVTSTDNTPYQAEVVLFIEWSLIQSLSPEHDLIYHYPPN